MYVTQAGVYVNYIVVKYAQLGTTNSIEMNMKLQ